MEIDEKSFHEKGSDMSVQIVRKKLEKMLHGEIDAHLEGVAQHARKLALKRALDPELCEIAGLLHDIARELDPGCDKHGVRGAQIARDFLQDILEEEQIEQVCSMIRYHPKKLQIHGPYEELLKDADVLDHVLGMGWILTKDRERIRQLKAEGEL